MFEFASFWIEIIELCLKQYINISKMCVIQYYIYTIILYYYTVIMLGDV